MDEQKLDELQADINNKNTVEERFINLNRGKKEAEAKAETLAKEKSEVEAKLAQMEKDTSFLNSFSDVTAKFPSASEYKDKIREKVMTGYSVDDATISILHAEGKLNATPVQQGNVAGGSATNQITQSGSKTIKEMSSSERWDALKEAEKKGDIGMQ